MFKVEADAPVAWSAKRPRGGASEDEGALLRLLAEKGQRNGALRAEAERRMEALLTAREDLRVAHAQIAALQQQVEQLQSSASAREEEEETEAAVRMRAAAVFAAYNAAAGRGGRDRGTRGKAKEGAERAGWPSCETAMLPCSAVPFFRSAGLRDPYDLKRAIVALKTPHFADATPELRTVSGYQARDALLIFRLCDAPWKRGCVASFLAYMGSRAFEDTGARDRRHWLCMKLWPGRFGTPAAYLQHEACMSKAGKFITSIGKLRAVYERHLAVGVAQKAKGAAL